MLLVNKKQVSVKEIERLLGVTIPLDKILKKPLFEINPALIKADPDNGLGAVKVRQGMEFPAWFRTRLKSGENVEIRYCTNRTPDVKTHGQTEIFAPKKVPFEGKAEFVREDDLAVYYYLHFYNEASPFRGSGMEFEGKPFEYAFQNDEAKANAQIAFIELRSKATQHAMTLEGEEMLIIAKGLRNGNARAIEGVEAMEPQTVRAHLMQYADAKPKDYLEQANSQVNHIEGLIFDAMDKDVFVLETGGSVNRWIWARGVKKGELIVELAKNSPDHRQALITHIQQTPGVINQFLPVLLETRKAVAAESNINKELAGVDIMGMIRQSSAQPVPAAPAPAPVVPPVVPYVPPVLPIDNDEDELDIDNEFEEVPEPIVNADWGHVPPPVDDLPRNFNDAKAYLGEKIGKKTPALASQLFKGVEDGTITPANVGALLAEWKDM